MMLDYVAMNRKRNVDFVAFTIGQTASLTDPPIRAGFTRDYLFFDIVLIQALKFEAFSVASNIQSPWYYMINLNLNSTENIIIQPHGLVLITVININSNEQ